MMNFFRRHVRVIFTVTIVAFVGVAFLGTGSYFFGPRTDYAAKVNGVTIPMKLYNAVYLNLVEMYRKMTDTPLSEQNISEIKVRVLQALVQDEIFYQQSKLYDIVVGDEELKLDLQNSAAFKEDGVFNKKKYMAFLTSIRMSPSEYESLRKKQIAGNKIKMTIASSIKIWEYEIVEAVNQDPQITRNALTQSKINALLNEWYSNIIKNSTIVSNDLIFKS